jgi:hypothetical protein
MARSSFPWRLRTAHHGRLLLVIATLLIGHASFAHEPDALDAGWTKAELRTAHDHALTMPLVRELATIGRKLNALATQPPETCHWMNQLTGPETLARQVRAFNDYARVRQVIEAHLSVQQYLLTLYVLNETSTFVHGPEDGIAKPAGASVENIVFYKANQVEIETLLDEPDPC